MGTAVTKYLFAVLTILFPGLFDRIYLTRSILIRERPMSHAEYRDGLIDKDREKQKKTGTYIHTYTHRQVGRWVGR
jgi:hypothetical protein